MTNLFLCAILLFSIVTTSKGFKKSPLSKTKKHPDFQVTLCIQNDTTNANFAYIESE
jgi:hypothetical protein